MTVGTAAVAAAGSVRAVLRLGLLLPVCLVFATACGERPRPVAGPQAGSGPLRVVATTARTASLVSQVGERRVTVSVLVARDVDPQRHVLSAADLRVLRRADLVVRSGGALDAWIGSGVRQVRPGVRVLALADATMPPPEDARWWAEPRGTLLALGALRGALAQLDPERTPAYARATERAAQRIRERAEQSVTEDRPLERIEGDPRRTGERRR